MEKLVDYLYSLRENYQTNVDNAINTALENKSITEEEAAELKSQF